MHHSPWPLSVPALLMAAVVLHSPCAAQSRPGEVLEGVITDIAQPGKVAAVSLLDDGSVDVAGEFSRVNGRMVPGLVRLRSDGTVEENFVPGAGLALREGLAFPLPGQFAGMCPVMLQLGGGMVAIGDRDMNGGQGWAILNLDGAWLPDALPALSPQQPALPQFAREGKLVVIAPRAGQSTATVRRLRLSDGLDDPSFLPSLSGEAPEQLLPASGGGLWLLGSTAAGGLEKTWRLSRLRADGQPDPAHTPRTFTAATASLTATPAGTLALHTSSWQPSGPSPSWDHSLSLLNAAGAPLSGAPLTLAGEPPFLTGPDGSVVMAEPLSPRLVSGPGPRPRTLWRRLPNGDADLNFHPPLAQQTLTSLPDGRLLADGQHRYLADGSPDPSWSVPLFLEEGTVKELHTGPGGTVLGAGTFSRVNGQPRPGIARWQADGSLDEAFSPAAEEGAVLDIAPLPDGRVFVVRRRDEHSSLVRLLPDGAVDASFTAAPQGGTALHATDAWRSVASLPDGGALASLLWLTEDGWEHRIVRFLPNGVFRTLTVSWTGTDTGLYALPDGRFFADGRRHLADGRHDPAWRAPDGITGAPLCSCGAEGWLFRRLGGNGSIVRLRDDGSLDAAFTCSASAQTVTGAAAGPGRLTYLFGRGNLAAAGPLARLYHDGRRDPAWHPSALERRSEGIAEGLPLIGTATNGMDATVSAALVHPVTGELWLAGDFTRANGQRRSGLVRLNASVPAGFAAWSNAIFSRTAEAGADPDGDGTSNSQEYASGTDPLVPDAAGAQIVILHHHPLCVAAPQNPAAPEIVQSLEVSADLTTWHPATGAEAVRKFVAGRAAFELAPAAGRRYVRIRYLTLP